MSPKAAKRVDRALWWWLAFTVVLDTFTLSIGGGTLPGVLGSLLAYRWLAHGCPDVEVAREFVRQRSMR